MGFWPIQYQVVSYARERLKKGLARNRPRSGVRGLGGLTRGVTFEDVVAKDQVTDHVLLVLSMYIVYRVPQTQKKTCSHRSEPSVSFLPLIYITSSLNQCRNRKWIRKYVFTLPFRAACVYYNHRSSRMDEGVLCAVSTFQVQQPANHPTSQFNIRSETTGAPLQRRQNHLNPMSIISSNLVIILYFRRIMTDLKHRRRYSYTYRHAKQRIRLRIPSTVKPKKRS